MERTDTTTRRSFIAGTAAMGLAALMAASRPLKARADEIAWDRETGVLVAGCGTGGCAAAIEAADAGADVLVIEKRDWAGGQLRRCGGGIMACCTQVQEKLGVQDSVEDFYEYWLATTNGYCDPELVRAYAEGSASVIDWIIDDLGGQPLDEWEMAGENNGLEYSEGPGLNVGTTLYADFGFEPVQRCHWFTKNPDDEILADPVTYLPYSTGGGTGLWKTIDDAMNERGIETLLETSLVRLVTDPASGEIVGAVAQQGGNNFYIKVNKGVVIATGNFASNEEMFHNYIMGEEWVPGVGGGIGLDLADENDGSGIRVSMSVGGDLIYPGAFGKNQDTPNGASFVCSGIKVNVDGQVIDVFGEPIPRLYAVGLAAGGIIAQNYPACGASVGRALFFGRKAGAHAAGLESAA